MTKWVYSFGAGHNEGGADMRNLLGGKGANLAGDGATIGLPVSALASTASPPRSVPRSTRVSESRTRDDLGGQRVHEALDQPQRGTGAEVRRQAQAAPGLGPLRRAGLDARDDGYRPQPGVERRALWKGSRRGGRRPALRSGLVSRRVHPAMHGSVVLGVDHHRFEEIIEHAKLDTGVTEDTPALGAGLVPRGAGWRKRYGSRTTSASRFRRTPRNSFGAQSVRCSVPG